MIALVPIDDAGEDAAVELARRFAEIPELADDAQMLYLRTGSPWSAG